MLATTITVRQPRLYDPLAPAKRRTNLSQDHNYNYTLRQRRSDETLRGSERQEAFVRAVVEGQLPRVRNFLRMGVDLDDTGSSDLTVLHRAVLSGHEDVVQILLEAGADVNAMSDDFGTPLCLAALKGLDKSVSILLKYRAKADATSKKVGTALHCCILSLGDHTINLMALIHAGARLTTQATIDTQWLHVICGWDGDDRTQLGSPRQVNSCILYDATPAFVAVRSLQDDLLETLLPPDLNQAFLIEFWRAEDGSKSKSTSSHIRELQALEDEYLAFGPLRHTYLSSCATNGDLDGVKLLITKGAKLDSDHETVIVPLMATACSAHTNIAMLLLESGASVHETGRDGITALHCAAVSGAPDMVRLLCERGAIPDTVDNGGATALYRVCSHSEATDGHSQVVSALCELGATVDAQSNTGATAIFLASRWGSYDIVCLLCERGAMIDMKDYDGWTVLHYVANRSLSTGGHRQVIRTLCERGASVDAQANDGTTALHTAASKGAYDIACVLCEYGAVIDVKDNIGWTALHCAAGQNHTFRVINRTGQRFCEVVRLLCEHGAAIDIKDDLGWTALYYAIMATDAMPRGTGKRAQRLATRLNACEIVGVLCEHGAMIDIKDNSGWTALHCAVDLGNHQVVRTLCERGAIVDARDSTGCTPLWHAANHVKPRDMSCCDEDWHVTRMLVDAGADINARCQQGRTPLLAMLRKESKLNIAIIDKLVRAGAETSARDNNDISVLRICFSQPFANAIITTIGKALGFDDATNDSVRAQLELICQEFNDDRQREKMLVYRSATKEGGEDLRLALALGADIDMKSDERGTAMHSAARLNECDTIDRLFAAGASMECFDHKWRTPLAAAVCHNRTEAVRALIRHGSNPRARGAGRGAQTAIEIATRKRNRTILGILK
jgi:ankyrin repeat protein